MGKLHTETLDSPAKNDLIILHGWGRTSDALRPLAQLLRNTTRPTLIDLPGFGKSDIPPDVWSSFDFADRIAEHMDSQGIAKSDFLGHSFGGKVALSMTLKYPERVNRLILIASSGLPRQRTLLQTLRRMAIRSGAFLCKKIDAFCGTSFYKEKFIPTFASIDYKSAGPMRNILVKSVNEDLSCKLQHVKAPTLLLWGENDTETPQDIAANFHRGIANSTLVMMPYKGHEPFHDVGSHLCARYITAFLQKE
jgi:pimeloyl-ACP methyl ester carboxylesterase